MKKTQNIFLGLVVLLVALVMVGCDNNDNGFVAPTGTPTNPDDILAQIRAEEDHQQQSDPNPSGNITTDPVVVDDPEIDNPGAEADWYSIYMVSEDWAKSYKGAYLEEEGFLFSLNDATNNKVWSACDIGWRREDMNVTGLYSYADMQWKHIFSCGDFGTPICNKDAKIRSYGTTKLTFQKVNEVGYGVPLVISSNQNDDWGYIPSFSSSDVITISPRHYDQFTVTCDGEVVNDYFNMKKNSNVVMSWFEGTDYKEVSFIANCRTYEFCSDIEPIVIEGELNKDSYATYDISSLPEGTYWISETCGMITIE